MAKKGVALSVEHRRKIGDAQRGKKRPGWAPWNKGIAGLTSANAGSFKAGQVAWNFKGRYKRTDGYIDILMPEHPHAHGRKGTLQKYVFEHRLVMEQSIGRYLLPEESVHHRNHIRDDNCIENLELCANNAEHKRKHVQQFPEGTKSCSVCKEIKLLDQFPFRKCSPMLTLQRRFYGSWCYPCSRAKKRESWKRRAGAS